MKIQTKRSLVNFGVLILGVNILFMISANFINRENTGEISLISKLIIGSKVSFMPSLISSLLTTIIGVLLGAFSGYFRKIEFPTIGRIRKSLISFIVIMIDFIMDLINSLPRLITVILCYLMFNRSMSWTIFILGAIMIPSVVNSIKGKVIGLRRAYFIEALKCSGITDIKIIWYHILWSHCKGYILSSLAQIMSVCIIVEAGLNFVLFTTGQGCSSGSWGCLLAYTGKDIMRKDFTSVIFAVWIFLTIFSFVIIADWSDKMTIRE